MMNFNFNFKFTVDGDGDGDGDGDAAALLFRDDHGHSSHDDNGQARMNNTVAAVQVVVVIAVVVSCRESRFLSHDFVGRISSCGIHKSTIVLGRESQGLVQAVKYDLTFFSFYFAY